MYYVKQRLNLGATLGLSSFLGPFFCLLSSWAFGIHPLDLYLAANEDHAIAYICSLGHAGLHPRTCSLAHFRNLDHNFLWIFASLSCLSLSLPNTRHLKPLWGVHPETASMCLRPPLNPRFHCLFFFFFFNSHDARLSFCSISMLTSCFTSSAGTAAPATDHGLFSWNLPP